MCVHKNCVCVSVYKVCCAHVQTCEWVGGSVWVGVRKLDLKEGTSVYNYRLSYCKRVI